MSQTHEISRETHILGARSRRWAVRVNAEDSRPWLATAALCAELAHHHILHLGISDMAAPYRVVRTQQSGAYFLACFEGEGRILVDGRWRTCRAGTACLLPAHVLNAFHAVAGIRWKFCWVRYEALPKARSLLLPSSPVLASFAAEPLRLAIEGLRE
ncbi:MAG: AraC family ligand binding domain-containing protein, partial [Chthoniobacter sp.]